MKNKINLSLNQILTIPNILSLFRIVLIPFIVLTYFAFANNYLAIGLIILSAFTDIIDGIISRKFNMVSDLGKILDPIADKLTLGVIIICLALQYVWVHALILLFTAKEITMGVLGLITIKKCGEVNSAKWYGKANTVILYLVTGLLILFPKINLDIANAMIALCFISLIFSLIMYIRFYVSVWKNKKIISDQEENEKQNEKKEINQ